MHNRKPLAIIILLSSLTLLLSSCCSVNQYPKPIDLLFIAYDQGESNAFIQIEKSLTASGIQYNILAFGRAAEVFADHPHRISLPPSGANDLLRDNRDASLPPTTIETLIRHYTPRITYSGMASTAQAQLLSAFAGQGSYAIAFYDNFDTPSSQPYLNPFLGTVSLIDELHVPTSRIQDSFRQIPQTEKARIIVTGQPTLEQWDEIYAKTDSHQLRQQFGLSNNDTVVLFAGGYDKGYQDSFNRFIQATRQFPDVKFLVTHHPKYDGHLEAEIIKTSAANNVQLIPKGASSTAAISKIAAAVVTHKSTVGAQALYKGKPVLYIASPDYTNFLIADQLAIRAFEQNQVVAAIKQLIDTSSLSPAHSLQLSDQPSQTIANRLMKALKNSPDDSY